MNKGQLYAMNIHYRYYDLEYFFRACKKNEIKKAEIWLCPQHFLINSIWMENGEKLMNLMEEYSVDIVCLCPEQNNPKPSNIAARGELLIENTKMYFQKVIELANQISCGKILVTPGWNYHDEDYKVARERSIIMLQWICDRAKSFGIEVAMESIWNHSSYIADTKEKVKYIKDRVNRENFKLTIDLGALGAAGESIDEWYEMFGQDIVHCHFTDGSPEDHPVGHMPWGLGKRNMYEVLKSFSKHGYQGGFSMEYVDGRSFVNPEEWDRQTKKQFEVCVAEIRGDEE